ncbi:MAG: hypothetical protein A3C11_02000 [Candidatus Sungbacteria bacterium RIFCSPHIGHO2_02_FULL_49_12]|uniref:Sialidase domain-containing protein n=1 Tax=Candidatus Sungbacteria bacterium RIFCSPHIGHO2_02_FULL_49_12 TaxID=1802271 RepID=A0A1G2KLG5_9BACT|nr:MAG: hypothetical protein A3C11_02000 [Candidatus Sungbacteria bacterium RIFCSPHIGHO2_02_FULL_49_12]
MNNPEPLIPSSSPGEDGNLPARILAKLNRDYVIVGKTHVRAWQSWLALGLTVGLVSGVLWIANQNGQVGAGKAATGDAITVELDLPNYYPEFLRHPQKFFSGQPLKITAPAFPDQDTVTLTQVATGKQQSLSVKRSKGELDKGEAISQSVFSFTPPADLPAGQYRVSFYASGQTYQFQLTINGLTAAEKDISGAITIPDILQWLAIRYRTKICDGCFWEIVFAGAHDNSQTLVQSYAGPILSRSADGGRTWSASDINAITAYPRSGMDYGGDSKAVVENNGSFLLSSLMWTTLRGQYDLGGVLYSGSAAGGLTATIFKDVSLSAPTSTWLFVDYPKLASDPSTATVYLSGNGVWFDATQQYGYGLFVSLDGGKTFSEYPLSYTGSAITSLAVGEGGTLYAGYLQLTPTTTIPAILLFTSITPPIFGSVVLAGSSAAIFPPKISATSTRAWFGYLGPEIVADTDPRSSHQGRLFAIWSRGEKDIPSPEFQYPYYGYNFDVFASYSDDKGQTWSSPAKVNDDDGGGDQFFASARVSSDGILHVAFVDRRNNKNLPVFDIYYAKSSDGIKFSKNLRINTDPIANNPSGGRTIGDYLDMVAAYPTRVYIAYPCGQSSTGPTGACMAQVDPRLVR